MGSISVKNVVKLFKNKEELHVAATVGRPKKVISREHLSLVFNFITKVTLRVSKYDDLIK
jgi:hypothetical protein